MDIPRPSLVRGKRFRVMGIVVSSLFALALITVGLARWKPAVPAVIRAAVWVDTVKRGPMLREVRGAGVLVPEEIQWVTATSPGRIERIPLLPGVAVTADTVLLELSNPELEQAAFDAESLLQTAEAQLEKLKVQLESDHLTLESSIATIKSEWTQARLEAEADAELARDRLVSALAARRSRSKADDLATRLELEQKRVSMQAQSARALLAAQQAELAKCRKHHQLKQRQVEALKVRARFLGVLQRLGDPGPLQVGQQVAAGTKLAQIADPARLKAEIKVAETQARDIQIGQGAIVDTYHGVVSGRVSRVDPVVLNGTVTVDIALHGALPKGARPDLSIEGIVTLERLDDVLQVGRPVNTAEYGRASLFRVLRDRRQAVRTPVRLGRSSVHTIEVLDGLDPGDEVILSDMAAWAAHERIRLN
ncbi:MAG: HlyD family efflux transporter periplasmic adaptor subunit [Verrucomicrobia bacterium]|nr:HlyD family efflux transporter periplasmic adaptor subunit [Verrucomicrobiota bacterium]